MIFPPYYYFETGCAAYLLGCGGLGQAADFTAETGIPLSYVIILHEDVDGNPPDGSDVEKYANAVKVVDIPVTGDATNQTIDLTPWTGVARPGKCAMSPDMVMLACYTGEDDAEGFGAIKAHAGL